jgi:hypothetical protein
MACLQFLRDNTKFQYGAFLHFEIERIRKKRKMDNYLTHQAN